MQGPKIVQSASSNRKSAPRGTARRPKTPDKNAPKHKTFSIFRRSFAFCFAVFGGSGSFGGLNQKSCRCGAMRDFTIPVIAMRRLYPRTSPGKAHRFGVTVNLGDL